jgi:hypothetical protein
MRCVRNYAAPNCSLTQRCEINMMNKLLVPFVGLFLISLTGCCSVFGLCASASVHTSISSPQTFAQQDKLPVSAEPFNLAQGPAQSATCAD